MQGLYAPLHGLYGLRWSRIAALCVGLGLSACGGGAPSPSADAGGGPAVAAEGGKDGSAAEPTPKAKDPKAKDPKAKDPKAGAQGAQEPAAPKPSAKERAAKSFKADEAKAQEDAFRDELGRGRKEVKAKRYAEGIKAFEAALKIDPNHPSALAELGWAAFLSDELAVAERYTRRAIDSTGASDRTRGGGALQPRSDPRGA